MMTFSRSHWLPRVGATLVVLPESRSWLRIGLMALVSLPACSSQSAPSGSTSSQAGSVASSSHGSASGTSTSSAPGTSSASSASSFQNSPPPDSGTGPVVDAAEENSNPENDGGEDASESAGDGGTENCGTAQVCDTFETYTSATLAPWALNMTNGTVAIDQTHAYSGTQAVKFHINAGANNAAQMTRSGAPVFPETPNLFWGRMMVYMTELPANAQVHWDNIQADGQGTGQYRIGGQGTVLLNYQPNDCYDHPSAPIPHDMWSCWQWLFDGTTNTIEFYIGGQLQAKVVNTGQGCTAGPATSVWAAPTFNAVHLGWINYQATTAAVDMWIDDVALGPEEIACPGTFPNAH